MSTDPHDRPRQSPDEGPTPSEKPKSSLSIAQVAGGALAAMTAAALGSRLSVAGTVVGAALDSVVAAVAGTIYTASLRRTSRHVSAVLTRVRPTAPGAVPPSSDAANAPAVSAPAASSPVTSTAADPTWVLPAQPADATEPQPRRPRIGWKPVVVGALLMFAIAAVALTGIELATGHALSGGTGTTVGQVAEPGTRPSSTPTQRTSPTPSPSATASRSPSSGPSPTASDTPSSEPTAGPSSSATAAPSATPTLAPSATPSATVGPSGAAATP